MQRVLDIGLDPELCLDNLIVGKNINLLESLKNRLNVIQKPMYIYGEHSCGKTHILQAITSFYLSHNSNAIYFDLANNYNLSECINILTTADVLLLDNLNVTSLEEQKIIFDIFNNSTNCFNLIISGIKLIEELDVFPDLKTRIMQTLVSGICTLNDNEKIDALVLRANHKNIHIKADIFRYLQTHYFRDLTKLMNAIDILDKESLVRKKQITKKMLQEIF